jgi:uncharacterized protein (DUF488 family)
MTVWTIGHSTRELDAFLGLLLRESIEHLADVRSFPSSRRYPHFNRDQLRASLEEAGIRYSHHPALGGRRPTRADSVNGGWRNASFRGYADHMASQEFRDALDALIALAAGERTTVMCAEAVPWRCHRTLIADALVARHIDVRHIMDAKTTSHVLSSFAVVHGDRLTYPPIAAPPDPALDLFP